MGKLLTIEEASALLHISVGTLRNWRTTGTGPPSGKLGRRVFYKEEIVLAWREAQFASGPSAA